MPEIEKKPVAEKGEIKALRAVTWNWEHEGTSVPKNKRCTKNMVSSFKAQPLPKFQ